MLKILSVVCICFTTLVAFSQSAGKYQLGTITAVRIHQPAQLGVFDAPSYDVSVKVDDTTYVVLYIPPQGVETVKYAAGRDGLVLVGRSTIRYNDLLGQSHELPIESQTPTNPRGSNAAVPTAK